MILIDEKGVLRVTYEEDAGIQVHEWLDYNPEGRDELIRQLLDRIYQRLIDFPVEKLLVKADQARGAFSPEVQAFIREVQFPRLQAQASIRFVVTVRQRDTLASIGTELWKSQLKANSRLIMHDVESEAEARAWLAEVDEISRQIG